MQHHALHAQEVLCDRDGERSAFFGIGGRAELVQQDERRRVGLARDAVEVDDVRGEAREVALDGLRVANVGVDAGEERQPRFVGRNRNTRLRHQGQQPDGLERDSLAAGVWVR